jgi:dihydroorotate dehydrogenase
MFQDQRMTPLAISLLDLGLPIARLFEAEDAHRLAIAALQRLPLPPPPAHDPRLAVEAFDLRFPNPVGLAAGFDKNAEVPDAALRLGFGFVEVGTLTPKPQPGNPRPRVFRLPADGGVINRLGFNNEGFAAAHKRLLGRRRETGIVGVNIGANRESVDRAADYVTGVETFAALADYITVNVSSPNTPGLRDLQAAAALDDLAARVIAARDRGADGKKTPVLLKISPDLSLGELDDVVAVAKRRGIDGIIVSNTTLVRPKWLTDRAAREQGGLSGKPLFPLSTRLLAETFVRVERAFPLVGVGGIDSADSAWQKIRAGATLVQLYSALIFNGFSLVGSIRRGLAHQVESNAVALSAAVGADAKAIVREAWPR